MKKVLQKPSTRLNRLLQQSQYLEYLSKRILTYLPNEFSNKISVLGFSKESKKTANNKQPSLVILATSPTWASKLRFYVPILKRSLRTEAQFSQINKIIIRTASPNTIPKNKHSKPIYSPKSASIVYDSAQCINDIALKEALIHLAHNLKKPSSQ
ncbi:MAG: DUF721 domain-containing protein [Gammaproteobacteria bacterium]|nr:DUF721 domain-containing protein [Gammaproteobacteria bacterium]